MQKASGMKQKILRLNKVPAMQCNKKEVQVKQITLYLHFLYL